MCEIYCSRGNRCARIINIFYLKSTKMKKELIRCKSILNQTVSVKRWVTWSHFLNLKTNLMHEFSVSDSCRPYQGRNCKRNHRNYESHFSATGHLRYADYYKAVIEITLFSNNFFKWSWNHWLLSNVMFYCINT